jgi:membrane-bound lytic murein transglycosylase
MKRLLLASCAAFLLLGAAPLKAEEKTIHDKARERREQISNDRETLKGALKEAETRQKAERKELSDRFKSAHAEMEARHKKESETLTSSYDSEKTQMLRRHEKERVDMVGRYDPVIKTDADELKKLEKKQKK